MSLITPNNKSQSVSNIRTNSSKSVFKDIHQADDELSSLSKLSTLQVINDTDSSQKTDQPSSTQRPKDDHEHPCVCDLKLPRKTLSSEERYNKAKDYLSNESKTQQNDDPPRLAKTFHANPAGLDDESSRKGVVDLNVELEANANIEFPASKNGNPKKKIKKSKKDKDRETGKKAGRRKKKMNGPDYAYQMLGEGANILEKKSKHVEGKTNTDTGKVAIVDHKAKCKNGMSKVNGEGQSLAAGSSSAGAAGSSSAGAAGLSSAGEAESSPRKNIRWRRQPQIAVKMNRTATLRLEKGPMYCPGARWNQRGISKVDEYFAKRAKRLAALRAKARAEAEAKLRGDGSPGSDISDDEASQKCEYMRCGCKVTK